MPRAEQSPLAGRRLAVLGAGAVGGALAPALVRAGARCTVWSRDPERARALARRAGAGARAEADLGRVLARADLLLLCPAEAGLAPLARRLARAEAGRARRTAAGRAGRERIALHTNGLLGSEPLAPLAARGWACGRLHPLVSLPPGAPAPPRVLRGAGFAIGGDPAAFRAGDELARALGGRPFELDLGHAALYHAAAALLAGGLAALLDLARAAAERAVEPPEEASRALAALARSVLANAAARGPGGALSGPLARGAAPLVRAHLAALGAHDPLAARAYALLGARALGLARARGSIGAADERRLRALLGAAVRRHA